jgi:hypothetical protein
MSQRDHPQTRPNFDAPIEIVADPSLSKQEKAKALEDLEQEARQFYRLRRKNKRTRADATSRSAPCERGAGATLYGFRL